MAYLINIEKDLRQKPARFTVSLSDNVRKKLEDKAIEGLDVSKLTHIFYPTILDEHFLLIEQTNLTAEKSYFGISHNIPEAEQRLSTEALRYSRQLKGNIQKIIDAPVEINRTDFPYENWREDNSNLISILTFS